MTFKCLVGEAMDGGVTENKLRKAFQKKDMVSRGRSYIAPDSYDSSLPPPLINASVGQWENLPHDLVFDIIQRVESGGTSWPARRDVVACAAVCRLWRNTVKNIIKTPEQCGLLTFPLSLKQPGPRNEPIQCFIKRDRASSTYRLYLGLSPALVGDASKLLLAAKRVRKATKTEFLISLTAEEFSCATNTYYGKLSSNFLGTKFVICDDEPLNGPITKSHPKFSLKKISREASLVQSKVVTISYELNFLRTKGPRRMHCTMNAIPFPEVQERKGEPLVLKNKAPRWHEQLQCWCLNFKGRVTVASVKNFQLAVDLPRNDQCVEQDDVILQFGKIGKDIFTLDYRYPLSTFQAFAICLSSFDTKPACE